MLALTIALAAAPSMFLMVFFYLKDRYEPEPRGHVALAFGIGAIAFVPPFLDARFGFWERVVGQEWLLLGGAPAKLFEAMVMAAGTEELSKWALFLLLVYRWAEFDEPLDGVVYCVAMALGFATVENVIYVTRDGITVGMERAVMAVPAHALYGAVSGFYFGRAKLGSGKQGGREVTREQRYRSIAMALVAPILFHGGFDFTGLEVRGHWMWAIAVVFSVALWVFVLRRVHRAQEDSPFKPGS